MISPAEAITAMFGGVVALNIHLLISNLISVPRTLYCLSLGPTYVLALQVMVAVSIARMQCIILNQPFQLRSRKIKALLFLYAIFPMPYLVILVNIKVLPKGVGNGDPRGGSQCAFPYQSANQEERWCLADVLLMLVCC
ncbi:hypothetical protein M747DRAFT_360038 [Aspergillus niger ATCC 13496]|uniref:Uncharacterized protein n=1 Tax=Aspergillus niger ATCC 13496 TaxID=1353008 RepID=A0A370C7E9_ASPNG|nr:hypothetical protein M747DRAFT_360038 [Aspergillus niger ATCC 13496]